MRPQPRYLAWTALAALGLLLAAACGAWGLGLANTDWPMFHHDNEHTGVTSAPAVSENLLRWWQQTGGPVLSSPVVSAEGGVRKIWYLHAESWAGRTLGILGSRWPEVGAQELTATVPMGTAQVLAGWETSPASGDPNQRKQPDPLRASIPAGTWRFVFWAKSDVPRAVRATFHVYRFPLADPGNVTDLMVTDVKECAQIGTDLTQYTVEHLGPAMSLAYSDGIRIEMSLVNEGPADATVTMRFEGDTRTRVETPIWEKCILGGGNDGCLYAMDANTGNIFWTVATDGEGSKARTPIVAGNGASRVSNVVTLNTTVAHGLQPGDAISVAGVTGGATDFDGYFTVATVPSPTSLTYPQVKADDVAGGGTVGLRPNRIVGAPVVDDEGVIYAGTQETSTGLGDGRIYAVNPDGSVRWIYPSYRPKFYLRKDAGTVATTARMEHVPTNAGDYTSGCAPTAADNDAYYLITPRAINTTPLPDPDSPVDHTDMDDLPAGITNYGWIGEKDWATRRLLSGEWTLNLGLAAQGSGAVLPKANLYYRISKVTLSAGNVVRSQELLGWTKSDLLSPTAWFDGSTAATAEATTLFVQIHSPQTATCTFAAGEYPYVEFALRQSADSPNGATWVLVVDNQDSTVQTAGLQVDAIRAVACSPALSPDGVLYFGTLGGQVFALENTGDLRWVTDLPNNKEIRASPAIAPASTGAGVAITASPAGAVRAGGVVTITTAASHGLAVGRQVVVSGVSSVGGTDFNGTFTVATVLSATSFTYLQALADDTGGGGTVAPVISGSLAGRLYVASMDGHLYALDGNDGHILTGTGYENWPVNLGAPIEASPTLTKSGKVLVACDKTNDETTNGRLVCIDADSGDLIWSFTPSGSIDSMVATPALSADEQTVYAGSNDGHLYAVDMGDGSQRWQFPVSGDLGYVRSSPLVAHGQLRELLYLNDTGGLTHGIPTTGLSVTGTSGTQTGGYVLFTPAGGSWVTDLPTGVPDDAQSWFDGLVRAGQVIQPGAWRLRLWYRKIAAGAVTQVGYLHYRIVKKNSGTGAFTVLRDWTRWDTPLDIADTNMHAAYLDTASIAGVSFVADDHIYLQLAIEQTVAGSDPSDGWEIGVGLLTENWLETAPVGTAASEHIYFGAGDGNVWAIDATGVEVWAHSLREGVVSSPALTTVGQGDEEESVLYVGGTDWLYYAIGPLGPAGEAGELPEVPEPESPWLQLTKSADKQVAGKDEVVTYTIRVRNDSSGIVPATDVTITDPIPTDGAGTPQIAYVPGSGGREMAGSIVFTPADYPPLTDLEPGDSFEVKWQGTVIPDVVPPVGTDLKVYDSDPTPATPAAEVNDFRWGQLLFLDLKKRGQSIPIDNRATASDAGSGAFGVSNVTRIEAGYGHRYKLTFLYEPTFTSPTLPATNQPISIATEVVLNAGNEYRGQQEEGVEYNATDTAFLINIAPKGFPYSPSAVSVTEAPNRPWTPYHWRVVVQQQRAGTDGWGDPWGTARVAPERDFSLANPLAVTPGTTEKTGLLPGTETDAWGQDGTTNTTAFTAQNVSMFNLTTPSGSRPTNVVRWGGVGLDSGVTWPSPYINYDESVLSSSRLHFNPDYVGLGRGASGGPTLWAEIPRFLAPGTYGVGLPIYVDLTGSESWDPGEAFYEDAAGTRFTLRGTILQEPLVALREPVVDLSRYAHGEADAATTVRLVNEGNVPFDAGSPLTLQVGSALERSDLPGTSLWPAAETRPLNWSGSTNVNLAKQPVGSYRLVPTDPVELAAGFDEGQPVGHYMGSLAISTGTTPLLTVPMKATVTERRVLQDFGGTTPLQGMDIQPYAAWIHHPAVADPPSPEFWELNLYRSSRRPDTNTFYLYHNAAVLDLTDPANPALTWSADTRIPGTSDPDPLDQPAPPPSKRHLTPAVGVDSEGTPWLFWGGTRGAANESSWTDNRLIWENLSTGETTWSPDPVGDPRAASASLRLYPRPLGWTVNGVTPDNLRLISRRLLSVFAQGSGDDWRLLVNCERSQSSRADASQEWGAPSTPVYEELAIPLGSDITSAQEPTLLRDARRTYYLHFEQAMPNGGGEVSPPRLLDTWGPDAPAVDSIALGTSADTQATFRTNPGDPNLSGATAIPAGTWLFQVFARAPETSSITLLFRVQKVAADGTPTDLFEVGPTDPLGTDFALVEASVQAPPVALAATDRLQVQVVASEAGATLACDGIYASRVMLPVQDELVNVIFAGRSGIEGNNDLYWARFDPSRDALGEDPGLSAFGAVGEAPQAQDANRLVYVTRHKRWQMEAGVQFYYNGVPVPGTLTADANGEYTLDTGTAAFGRVKINPDSGRIRLQRIPDPQRTVSLYYVPRLLRLTESPGNDFSPSAFVETYRYADPADPSGQTRYPDAFVPRLWVFWVRSGGPGLGNNLYWKTYRPGRLYGDAEWMPEVRPNGLDGRWDVGETMVPLDHVANEFGISAVKDPFYAQVWLFWSSTRGKPAAGGATFDADLYYQVIAPPLPD